MSHYYNKEELKESLELEQIFDLLEAWGGEPEYTDKGLTSQTICHNDPGQGSRKLYYYTNTRLFKCYTGCPETSFDIFDLCIKVMKIQNNENWELYDAMNYIAEYFGLEGQEEKREEDKLIDWDIFKRHNLNRKNNSKQSVQLKEYNKIILTRFAYPKISPWEKEGILDSVNKKNFIGYYPGGAQITIPHFDINDRLIGIRGRALIQDEAAKYGKYKPLKVGKTLYTHPLSMNLYHLNKSKKNIQDSKIAIVFESEKATLMYESIYGADGDISCSCCGSAISAYQIYLLQSLGVNEVIIAFDRDFEKIGDDNFKKIKSKLIHIYNKYSQFMRISAIFDKDMILPLHSSPIDCGQGIFELLLKNRIIPKEE